MVDMGISSSIMKSPSPKCYMIFWDMIIYSDTLHWSDISPDRDIVTELDLFTASCKWRDAQRAMRNFSPL